MIRLSGFPFKALSQLMSIVGPGCIRNRDDYGSAMHSFVMSLLNDPDKCQFNKDHSSFCDMEISDMEFAKFNAAVFCLCRPFSDIIKELKEEGEEFHAQLAVDVMAVASFFFTYLSNNEEADSFCNGMKMSDLDYGVSDQLGM